MANTILGALDVGTQTTRLVAGKVEDKQLNVLQAVSVPTFGVKKGTVRNIEAVAHAIRKAFDEMSKTHHLDIYEVAVNFSAQCIKSTLRSATKTFVSPRTLEEEDAEEAEEQAYSIETASSPEVTLQRFKQRFRVNEQAVESPVGMKGDKLEASVLELLVPRTAVEALHSAVTQAGMQTGGPIFSGAADAEAVLDRQARADGALVINFGAGTCDYLAISNRIVVAAGSLGIGGQHLTNDLAQAFRINQDMAERMKLERGAAQIQPNLAGERYSLHTTFNAERSVSVHAIQTVTTERVNETFYLLKQLLAQQGIIPANLHGGVWLTGGTAALPNMIEQATAVLDCPCRLGVPVGVGDLPMCIQEEPHLYATAVGLLKWRFKSMANEGYKPSFLARMRSFFRG